MSERGYVTMLNKLRFDTFVREAEKLGEGATTEQLRDIATTINILSGRGNLGRFAEAGPVLNGIFFAPRFAISRFQAPLRVAMGSASARKLTAQALVSYASTVSAWLAMADLAGVGEVEWDPRSSDLGKLRIRGTNTRIDPWMGLQQPVVLVSRLISGQTKTTATKELRELDPGLVIQRFFETKLHPSPRAVLDIRRGEVFGGEDVLAPSPLGIPNIAYETFVSLFIDDVVEAARDMGPGSAIWTIPYSFFGGRIQTFGEEDQPARRPQQRVRLNPRRRVNRRTIQFPSGRTGTVEEEVD